MLELFDFLSLKLLKNILEVFDSPQDIHMIFSVQFQCMSK